MIEDSSRGTMTIVVGRVADEVLNARDDVDDARDPMRVSLPLGDDDR